jgi:hypothetical protein
MAEGIQPEWGGALPQMDEANEIANRTRGTNEVAK